ncbi:MAG TPA: translational machinery protein [bacterium]|nr:translational machinery protein [bacterium]
MRTHAAVWIDHREARVFHVQPETPGHVQPEPVDEATIVSPTHRFHRHPKGRGDPKEHPEDAARFFTDVARSLDSADTVLVVGPASAKQEFADYLDRHDPRLRAKIAGIETLDHPTDREIIAYARRYFKGSDRM